MQNNIEKEAQLFHFDDNPIGTKKIFIYLDQYQDLEPLEHLIGKFQIY